MTGKLPYDWCIKVTEENQHVLSNWRFNDGTLISFNTNCYVGTSKYGGKGHTNNKDNVWPKHVEISFEHFQKWILNIESISKPKEDLSYLINLLEQLK